MPIEDKEILIREIRNYQGDVPLIGLFTSLFNPKDRIKALVNNKAGILGSLLDKYKYELDNDILKEICIYTIISSYYDNAFIVGDEEEFVLTALCSCVNDLKFLNLVNDEDLFKKDILVDKEYIKFFISIINEVTDEACECLTLNSKDKEFYREILDNPGTGWILAYASDELKNDKDIVLAATEYCPDVFKYASDDLKKDKLFILEALSNHVNFDGSLFLFAADDLKKDKEFIKEVIKVSPDAFQYIDDELKNDKKFVSELVLYSVNTFEYCSEEIRNDPDIAFQVACSESFGIRYIGKELLYNYDFLYKCLNISKDYYFIYQWGLALVDLSFESKYDYFLNVIRNDKRFLEPLCIYFRNSYDFMLEAARIDADSLKYLSFDLANNIEFVLDLISLGIDITISDDMYKKVNEIYNS